ncbi:hypothetical protein EHM69_11350 [candidate division KSB1 bacterium]|nr:MAG: hypothetical protein EHM69_11350 [candidate division KSB1 bacterium]
MIRPHRHSILKRVAGTAALFLLHFTTILSARENDVPITLRLGQIDSVGGVAGDTVRALIRLRVMPGFHVNSNPAANDSYIPLEVKLHDTLFAQALKPLYPPGNVFNLKDSEEMLLVYGGDVEIEVPIVLRSALPAGEYTMRGMVEYQSCDDAVCFMPESMPLKLNVFLFTPLRPDEKQSVAEGFLDEYIKKRSLSGAGYMIFYDIEGDVPLSRSYVSEHHDVQFAQQKPDRRNYGGNSANVSFRKMYWIDSRTVEFEFGDISGPAMGSGALHRAYRNGSRWTYEFVRILWRS